MLVYYTPPFLQYFGMQIICLVADFFQCNPDWWWPIIIFMNDVNRGRIIAYLMK
jgi:hypothetical protein